MVLVSGRRRAHEHPVRCWFGSRGRSSIEREAAAAADDELNARMPHSCGHSHPPSVQKKPLGKWTWITATVIKATTRTAATEGDEAPGRAAARRRTRSDQPARRPTAEARAWRRKLLGAGDAGAAELSDSFWEPCGTSSRGLVASTLVCRTWRTPSFAVGGHGDPAPLIIIWIEPDHTAIQFSHNSTVARARIPGNKTGGSRPRRRYSRDPDFPGRSCPLQRR